MRASSMKLSRRSRSGGILRKEEGKTKPLRSLSCMANNGGWGTGQIFPYLFALLAIVPIVLMFAPQVMNPSLDTQMYLGGGLLALYIAILLGFLVHFIIKRFGKRADKHSRGVERKPPKNTTIDGKTDNEPSN